jgi:hypothetical protein
VDFALSILPLEQLITYTNGDIPDHFIDIPGIRRQKSDSEIRVCV